MCVEECLQKSKKVDKNGVILPKLGPVRLSNIDNYNGKTISRISRETVPAKNVGIPYKMSVAKKAKTNGLKKVSSQVSLNRMSLNQRTGYNVVSSFRKYNTKITIKQPKPVEQKQVEVKSMSKEDLAKVLEFYNKKVKGAVDE